MTFRPFDRSRRDSAPNFARFLSPEKNNNHGGHVIRVITGKHEYLINWRLRSLSGGENRRDKSRCRAYTMAALMIGRVAGSIRVMHYTLVVLLTGLVKREEAQLTILQLHSNVEPQREPRVLRTGTRCTKHESRDAVSLLLRDAPDIHAENVHSSIRRSRPFTLTDEWEQARRSHLCT